MKAFIAIIFVFQRKKTLNTNQVCVQKNYHCVLRKKDLFGKIVLFKKEENKTFLFVLEKAVWKVPYIFEDTVGLCVEICAVGQFSCLLARYLPRQFVSLTVAVMFNSVAGNGSDF